jgi:hypothetical protein
MDRRNRGPIYQSRVIPGRPMTAECHGLPLVIRMNDEEILAEVHRRGLWPTFEPCVKTGKTGVILDETPEGVDAFIWIGDPKDGGFVQWTLVGGRPGTPACDAMVDELRKMMPRLDVATGIGRRRAI